MHNVLPLALANAVAAAVAATALGGESRAPTATAFGGPSAVHIASIGHIETDLEESGRGTLRRVPCASRGASRCFVVAKPARRQ